MPLKNSVIADFDSRRGLFHKVVGSLDLLSPSDTWDLSWGEPFLALSRNRKLWVRVFYEESLPITAERLRSEAERLRPHVSDEGRLILCIPESWARGLRYEAFSSDFSVSVWSYSYRAGGGVVAQEMSFQAESRKDQPSFVAVSQNSYSEEKLSSDEIRELTEIGVEMKRYTLKKAG